MVIDETGKMIGRMRRDAALNMAYDRRLDLVEMAVHEDGYAVCRMLDYGKFKYSKQKKDGGKKQKNIKNKEIKLSCNISEHDYNTKLRATLGFLEDGHRVKIALWIRGREMMHKDIAMSVMEKFRDSISGQCRIESDVKLEGKQIYMIVTGNGSG